MKFFLAFLLLSFFGGMVTRRVSPINRIWLMAGVSMAVAFGYFFLKMI